jgi:hypothetical protein
MQSERNLHMENAAHTPESVTNAFVDGALLSKRGGESAILIEVYFS